MIGERGEEERRRGGEGMGRRGRGDLPILVSALHLIVN